MSIGDRSKRWISKWRKETHDEHSSCAYTQGESLDVILTDRMVLIPYDEKYLYAKIRFPTTNKYRAIYSIDSVHVNTPHITIHPFSYDKESHLFLEASGKIMEINVHERDDGTNTIIIAHVR